MATYQDDYRNDDNQGMGNDQLRENTEQTRLANAVSNDRQRGEGEGWENNKPGATTENNHEIPTVTPDNDNGIAGPFDFVDNNHINGAMTAEDAGYSAGGDGTDDEDLVDDDDDLLDDEDEEELIPIETDDDDDDLDLDDDDDDLDDDEDPDIDPIADRPTTFESDGDFATRDHGRVTGTMIDHEPGLPGSSDKRDYNL